MKYVKYQLLFFGVFSSFSLTKGQNVHYIAHEWGTFTSLCGSDGIRLDGLYKEEEPLPGFVHNIGGNFPNLFNEDLDDKGFNGHIQLENVTVKMETPVIYFYAKDSLNVDLKVSFAHGLIGQWYPADKAGVSIYDNNEYSDILNFGDADNPISNSIEWNARVLPETNSPLITKYGETGTWDAPRATNSNVLRVTTFPAPGVEIDEFEKFLFYRGIGNFDMPVNIHFDSKANLVIHNSSNETIPYFFVYEKDDDGNIKVWWTGKIAGNSGQIVSRVWKTLNESEFNAKLDEFQMALTNAGLYAAESAAMLNTWRTSYFGKSGLRVFWIVPRSFTDSILPMTIKPSPDSLHRVLIGRSEILTPDFERELRTLYQSDPSLKCFGNDRFYLAYLQRVEYLNSTPYILDSFEKIATIYDNSSYTDSLQSFQEKITLFPNPTNSILNVSISNPGSTITIIIHDLTGRNIRSFSSENITSAYYSKGIDLSTLTSGIYFIQVQTNKQKYTGKFVKE